MKIRVATYNIHKGVSSIRSTPRVLALKKAIGEFEADVVFLQEVQGRHDHYFGKFGQESRGHRHWPETSQHEYLKHDAHAHSA
jgi:endonuclease/exonuclease/phosphatase family metal-dependent hydrolase